MAKPRKAIRDAIISGPMPNMRPVEGMINNPRTLGERIISFAFQHLVTPEGMRVGKPLILEDFQIAFILAVIDNPGVTRQAIFSVARRNGKTFLIAVILAAYLVGPLAKYNLNATLCSAAQSRDQAAICHGLLVKMLDLSPDVQGLYRNVPSSKRVVGLKFNVEYTALAAEARSGFGRAYKVALLDEAGQIKGPTSEYVSMLETSSGSYDDSLMIIISTQAPSDQDYFSQQIDRAEEGNDPSTVAHVYRPLDEDCALLNKKEWRRTNPGLGIFRSLPDMRKAAQKAIDLPAEESGFRNLLMNARISKDRLAFAPAVWKRGLGDIDMDVFRNNPNVFAGCDLSTKLDLTAIVLAAKDDNDVIHTLPYVFTPLGSLAARSQRDRVPYSDWYDRGLIHGVAGEAMSYDQIAETMRHELEREEITVANIQYDKHQIEHFKAACERQSVFQEAEWVGVPQFFRNMAERLANFQAQLVTDRLRTGNHPVMNMAASQAVAQAGREGLAALAKDKSFQRIDVLVAAVMATWPLGEGQEDPEVFDVGAYFA
jgi:phage terminase large subunit-like protein